MSPLLSGKRYVIKSYYKTKVLGSSERYVGEIEITIV